MRTDAFQDVLPNLMCPWGEFSLTHVMLCRYDAAQGAFVCQLPESNRAEFYLHPAVVRRNDTSAKSINEWTREKILRYAAVI